MTFGTLHVIGLIAVVTLLLWAILIFIFYVVDKNIKSKAASLTVMILLIILIDAAPFAATLFVVDAESSMIINYNERHSAK